MRQFSQQFEQTMTYQGKSETSGAGFGHTEYTLEEREFLQKELEQKLGKEDIASRPGPSGNQVHYIETWRAIELANKIFGFNGWSSSIMEIKEDYVDQKDTDGRFNAGVSAIVRITLKDGAFHEDIGYGASDNQKNKGAAIDQAKKTAVSDGLKRALRNFGNALGLTIYDKDHLTKMKKTVSKPPVARQINPHFVNNGGSQMTQGTQSSQMTQPSQEIKSTQELIASVSNERTNVQPMKREEPQQLSPPVRTAPASGVQAPRLPPPIGGKPHLPPRVGVPPAALKRPNPGTDGDASEDPQAKKIKLTNE